MNKRGGDPGQQGGGGGGESMDFFWTITLILVAGWAIWYFLKKYIAMAIFQLKMHEIFLIEGCLESYLEHVAGIKLMLPVPTVEGLAHLRKWMVFMSKNYGSIIDFETIKNINMDVGHYLRYPFFIILSILSFFLYFFGNATRFRVSYSMEKLRDIESENWAQINVIERKDFNKMKLDDSVWGMPQNPVKFCQKYDLIKENLKESKGKPLTLRKGAAYRILCLQLGAKWRGAENLPEHLQILFTVFACCINNDKNTADKLIEEISTNYTDGQIFFGSLYKVYMHKYMDSKQVTEIISHHCYNLTVLSTMLDVARQAGVLPTSEFIWLKQIDRQAWYMLNSVGRYAAVSEISGAFAHWLAEKKLGYPIAVPMVEESIKGLEIALSEILYKPDDDV